MLSDFLKKIAAFFRRLAAVEEHTGEFSDAEIKRGRLLASLAVLPFLFWLPLATHSTSRFVRFHANNGALLLAASGGALILSLLLSLISFGWLFSFAMWALLAVLSVFYSIDALSGCARELPLIGKFVLISYD